MFVMHRTRSIGTRVFPAVMRMFMSTNLAGPLRDLLSSYPLPASEALCPVGPGTGSEPLPGRDKRSPDEAVAVQDWGWCAGAANNSSRPAWLPADREAAGEPRPRPRGTRPASSAEPE